MEIFILIFAIPGLILFELIPKIFEMIGLMDWYIKKYKTEADIILMFYFMIGALSFMIFLALHLSNF